MGWCYVVVVALGNGAAAQEPTRIPDTVKVREILGGDVEAAPRIDNEPIDPKLKGFFPIPGTDARMKIDGYLQVDLIHDFQPAGDSDKFLVGSIPVDVDSSADNTSVHARQSRLNVDVRRPTPMGSLRMFVEGDFFGSSGERAVQLRHAYGQIANMLVGFTISTLQDADARADTLDYEGPAGLVSRKHAQLRYTRPFSRHHSVAFAIEAPRSDIPETVDGEDVTARTPWPDIVLRYRFDAARGHLQLGGIWRSIGGFVDSGTPERQVPGGGVSVSGSLLTIARDVLTFQVNAGRGLSRYIHDTGGSGLDLGLEDGRARAVPLFTVTAGYQRVWHHQWRSTFAASYVTLDNTADQPADTYKTSRYFVANVIYKPSRAFSFGVEYDAGRLQVKDGDEGSAHRVQVSAQIAFLK